MPETDVNIVFTADASQVRRTIEGLEPEIKALQAELANVPKYEAFGGRSYEEYRKFRDEQMRGMSEVKENIKETTGFVDRLEGQFGRIVTRLIAFSAISAAIKIAWEGVKDLMQVQEEEVTWRNLIDDSEHGVEVFDQLKEAMHAANIDLKEGTQSMRMLMAAGETEDQAYTEIVKLSEAAKVLNIPLKEVTAEIAKIRQEGTITFGELVKLNEQTAGMLNEQVAAWRKDVEAIKDYAEAVKVSDKAHQEASLQSEKTISAQERYADNIGETKDAMQELQSALGVQHPEYTREEPGLKREFDITQIPLKSAIEEQLQAGISAMAAQTGEPTAAIERAVARGQIKAPELMGAAREQRGEAERLRREGEQENLARMRQQQTERQRAVAAAVPGIIENMPALTQKFQASMSTVGASLGQVGEQAKRTAEAFASAIAVLSGAKGAGYVAPSVPVAPGLRPSIGMFGVTGAAISGMEQARFNAGQGAAAIVNAPAVPALEQNTREMNAKMDQMMTILSQALAP
jgi:hypothetical protein